MILIIISHYIVYLFQIKIYIKNNKRTKQNTQQNKKKQKQKTRKKKQENKKNETKTKRFVERCHFLRRVLFTQMLWSVYHLY